MQIIVLPVTLLKEKKKLSLREKLYPNEKVCISLKFFRCKITQQQQARDSFLGLFSTSLPWELKEIGEGNLIFIHFEHKSF